MHQSRCESLVSSYSRSGIRARHEVYGTARTNEPIMEGLGERDMHRIASPVNWNNTLS